MKGKARRLLSWVCVLALCMSLLPVTALAVEQNVPTEGNSESYVQNGTPTTKDEVTVLSFCCLMASRPIAILCKGHVV